MLFSTEPCNDVPKVQVGQKLKVLVNIVQK